jgi:hypothetical protein
VVAIWGKYRWFTTGVEVRGGADGVDRTD